MTSQSAAPTAKYVITARFEVNGLVEKPDVIGALFGQTEGLFGPELDLRELQKNNRIGRIEVEMKTEHNKTHGVITVSSSLSMASTSLLAAVIESVDRIGPREAKVWIEKIEDVRELKRKRIIKRAKDLLKKWAFEAMPETEELMKEIGEAMKPSEITTYGPEQLPAGPDIDKSPSIILVEGRADVHNLLRCGIKNVVAIQGARVSETILKLGREKEITLFLDGDRAGDLILRELLETIHVKYVARAPPGKEVEELTCRDILAALKEKVPASEVRLKHARVSVSPKLIEAINNLKGTLEASLFNGNLEVVAQMPVSELAERLPQTDGVTTVVFDGIITQRLVDVAAEKGVTCLIGDRISELVKKPSHVRLLTFDEVAPESPAGPRKE
ncbi:DNA primase DnaG [Candidatus Hecatella orcuttiae]|uniref:DNA primase DnaG n=1 Tax=Candidatus Hecatella orcuttiae TaxID=1935119 RepID=UPI0028682752|nr:DNA primase DnaG [Candidatus Hecatella orcuttiae]